MRTKEESHDYRYFPDPDLPTLRVTAREIDEVRAGLPELPRERRTRFMRDHGLSEYEAGVLTQTRTIADYFEEVAEGLGDAKAAANWVMGPVQALVNERKESLDAAPVSAPRLVELLTLLRDGVVSDSAAKKVLGMLAAESASAREIVEREGLVQVRDTAQLEAWVAEVVEAHPEEVERYRGGEERLLGFLVGRVMARSRGQADPRQVNELLRSTLAS